MADDGRSDSHRFAGLLKSAFYREPIDKSDVFPAGDPAFWRKVMDWNRVEGNWKQLKGKIKEQWGKLTDDDLDKIAGRCDQLERQDSGTLWRGKGPSQERH
jgi:hypothetical protein